MYHLGANSIASARGCDFLTSMPAEKLILIVDDDPDIGSSLEELLTNDGYRVLIAKNGQEGLDLTRAHHPRVILLDIMMPVMDGYEFLRIQREDPSIAKIPVIVLSAGMLLERLPRDIPRLPKPPELLALFSLIEAGMRASEPPPSVEK